MNMDQLAYIISQESDVEYNTRGIPSKCPAADCEERIPAGAVDEKLCEMFKKYRAAVKCDNADSDAAIQQATIICIYITTIKKTLESREEAARNGFPEIDFRAVPERVVAMKDSLRLMIFDEGLKSENLAQRHFNMGLKIHKPNGRGLESWSSTKVPRIIVDNARPG
jgi:hypothetical protein